MRAKNVQFWSDIFVEDASFVRMDNLTLGYNFKDIFSEGSRTMHFARLPFPFFEYISLPQKELSNVSQKPIYRICRLNTPTNKSGL